jgi:5-methylcytosine-specific restriction endonuclease McrA
MAADDIKQCTQCKQLLPFTSFPKGTGRKDGLYPWCRACNVAKCQEYTAKKPGWKEFKRAYDKARVERLKDQLRVQSRARYERKREQIIAQSRAYHAAHPEQVKATKQSYKHRRRTVERAGMSGRELADWKRAQIKACHWCGVKCPRGFVIDHIQPLAKGGKHEAHNLAISCRSCNASKAARDPIEFAQSLGKLL